MDQNRKNMVQLGKFFFCHKKLVLVFLSMSFCIYLLYTNQFLPQHIFETKKKKTTSNGVLTAEKQLFEMLKKNCTIPGDNYPIDIKSAIITMKDFKKYLAKKFIEENANPFPKSKIPPKLETFEKKKVPSPGSRLKFSRVPLNNEEINKDLLAEKQRRLKLGDDDPLEIKEVRDEIENSTFAIPNIIHYIWFKCHKFYLLNYICMLGAFRYQQPKLILFHTNCEPEGEYWNVLKHILGDTLKIVKRSPPDKIWGSKIAVIEHRADVARLQIEIEIGGIYLDTDTAVLKQFDDLRKHEMVLAEEQEDALANGIILANRNAWFLRRWYWEYKNFQDSYWGFNSVLVPWSIAKVFPDKIYIVKELICRPNYREVHMIYRELYDWRRNYMMHLYARLKGGSDGKPERTLKELAILNTTYGQMARHIIWGDEKPRNITDWITTCNATQILLDAMS